MKKMLVVVLFLTSLFAENIKLGNFVGIDAGAFSVSNTNYSKDLIGHVKLGFYFYEENPYYISNRIYLSVGRIFSQNAESFDTVKLNLDWIWTQIPIIKPFAGLDAGYTYKNADTDFLVGYKMGLLAYISPTIELELSGNVDIPRSGSAFSNNLRSAYAGINISF